MSRPIFVIGSMGSGTTLLRLMLDSHPNIMIAQETGFMRAVQAQYNIPFWKFGGEWLDRIGLTESDLDQSVNRFYNEVFGLAAQRRGATRWGDKTPYHVHHMALAARVFPDAQFVATVRHPGAVARSMDRFNWSWSKGIQHWTHSNQVMTDHGTELGDRFHLIRYEDLLFHPEPVLREVLGFLDEPWNDRVLEYHQVQGDRVAEGGTRASDPIDPERMKRWLNEVSAKHIAQLTAATAPQAHIFGYDPQAPVPEERLNRVVPDTFAITGDQLAAQIDALQPIRRVEVIPSFENRPFTVASLADELRKAYVAGVNGGRIRPAYRKLAEAGIPKRAKPAKGNVARVRRKVSRVINPDV